MTSGKRSLTPMSGAASPAGNLLQTVERLSNSPLSRLVDLRMEAFKKNHDSDYEVWFSELSFCILVAASTARSGLRAQSQLGPRAFVSMREGQLQRALKSLGVRFHNRAHYIIKARELGDFRPTVLSASSVVEARDWLVGNVIGIGYKEASHFLRNVGFPEVAILDRHILRTLFEAGYLRSPESPSGRDGYLQKERAMLELAEEASMLPGELDLYLWYIKTGDIVK
ncbi:MAG TPA: N-glycosylase/DNA lyase [Thermoproteota archaeon]|nr:N-glycosylase/DNA lyase [Thermoproteota archaeon]